MNNQIVKIMRQKQFLLLSIVLILNLALGAQNIHEAVKANNIEEVKVLLEKDSKIVNSFDAEHNTPLILACSDINSDIKLIELLIQSGADIDLGDVDNTLPLHLAAYSGHIKAVEILIQHKAKVDFKDNREQTPLLFAAIRGNIEIAGLLVEHGADVNGKIEYTGVTLLHLSLSRGKEAMAEFLISKGAKTDVRDNRGRLPLYDALDIGSHKLIDLILDRDNTINIEQDGTYFMEAAIEKKTQSVGQYFN